MPATAMFSKFKSSGVAQCPLETNPIAQQYEIGKQVASAGPELVWRIHDAYRKSDGAVRIKIQLSFRPRMHLILCLNQRVSVFLKMIYFLLVLLQ